MASLKGKTLFITGASRGIGLAIALRAARDGANIAIAAKTAEPHPKLPGTIYTAAEEIEEAGGKALPLVVRHPRRGRRSRRRSPRRSQTFGGIDICVNNASARSRSPASARPPMKRYDLMHGDQRARHVPGLEDLPAAPRRRRRTRTSSTLSPPLDMDAQVVRRHVAYTMAKYGMSLCVLGLAEELKGDGIAVNALWPRTTIATAAIRNLLGGESCMRAWPHARDHGRRRLRDPHQPAKSFTGQLPHRRQLPLTRTGRDATSSATASTGRCRWRRDFFVPDERPPPGVPASLSIDRYRFPTSPRRNPGDLR